MTEITQHDAIHIVAKHLECSPSRLSVLPKMPANFRIYKVTDEPSWIVRVAANDLELCGRCYALTQQNGAHD